MRKQEDWISRSLIIKRTGRSSTAISNAINSCIKRGWIEVRDKNGNLLTNPQSRARRKLYYRLGRIFLDKMSSSGQDSLSDRNDENLGNITKSSGQHNASQLGNYLNNTKETLTKETIQKGISSFQKKKTTANQRKGKIFLAGTGWLKK